MTFTPKYALYLLVCLSILSITLSSLLEAQSQSRWRNQTNSLAQCMISRSPNISLIFPGDSVYVDFRIGTNFRYDSYFPSVIVNVSNTMDIQASVLCAKEHKIEIIPMNGGHSFEGLSCSFGLILHLDNFSNVVSFTHNDLDEAFITVQSGMRLGRLYGSVINSTDKFAIAGGTCHTVGITGHSLCGGYGFMGRKIGFTSDQLISIEIVLADGNIVVANDTSHSDLFWALRGGCSSGFGIITTLTFKLFSLNSDPKMTTMTLPVIPFSDMSKKALLWFAEWASEIAPFESTSVMYFSSKGFGIQMLYIGNKQDAIRATFDDLCSGLNGLLSTESILNSYIEGTYLDAVIWWTGDSSITTLDDLLAVESLPPIESRSNMRRKAKSVFAMPGQLNEEAINLLVDDFTVGKIDQLEWKAYGGTSNVLSDKLYTDAKSPLLRGKAIEMHYGKTYHPEANESNIELNIKDKLLVATINIVSFNISKYFESRAAYPGYIDLNLPEKGKNYFGGEGVTALAKIRDLYDPDKVFVSKSSEYLFS